LARDEDKLRDREEILAAVEALLTEGNSLEFRGIGNQFVADVSVPACQYWFAHTNAVLESFLPVSSYLFQEAMRLAKKSHRQGGIIRSDVDALIGHLRFVRDGVASGLLRSLENEVSAADFGNFLLHARHYFAIGRKMEASVIASAILEDVVRRIGKAYGVEELSKLDNVISALRADAVIGTIEAKQLRYFAGIRNSALHASWGEFDIRAVGDLIEGIEKLLKLLSEAPSARTLLPTEQGDAGRPS
jgi:hypothetical protein